MEKKGYELVKRSKEKLTPEEMTALIRREFAGLVTGRMDVNRLLDDNTLRKSFRIAEELCGMGYRASLVKDAGNAEAAMKAFAEGIARDMSPAQFSQFLASDSSMTGEDRVFLQSAWLYRCIVPGVQALGEKSVDFYRALIVKKSEERVPFVVASLDEEGKPFGIAVCAYLPKSNVLLVKEIAIDESKRELGADSLLIAKAIDIANLKAVENGYAGVAAVAAEAEMPSSEATYSVNRFRLEKMGFLVNNGLFPVSGFEYSKPQEELISAAVRAERLVEEAAEIEEKMAVEKTVKSGEEILLAGKAAQALLFVRPLNVSQVTPKSVRKIVSDIRGLAGERELESIFSQLRGRAVLKILLLDVRKIFALGKILGMALPPGDEGGEGGEEEEEKEKPRKPS